eukprot:scaffold338416_cov37-Prasinocladus_malaysianus.AAC.1
MSFHNGLPPIAKAQMDEDNRTPSKVMAWLLLRYLSLDLQIMFPLTQNLKLLDMSLMACLPWMQRCFTTALSRFFRPRSRMTSAACDWISSLKPQLDDEDTQAYLDAVQLRNTDVEAAGLTFTFAELPCRTVAVR